MKTVEIESIKINNFQSVDIAEIEFPKNNGFYFIKGLNQLEPEMGGNGAGKSTLLDAICWALYGKTPKGFKASSIVSWLFDKTSAEVVLKLNIGTITRIQSPNSLKWEGRIIDQTHLDDIIGITFDQFLAMVLHGQSLSMFLEYGGADQAQFLTDIMDLTKWDMYQKKAKELQKQAQTLMISKQNDLKGIEGQLIQLDQLSFTKEYEEWENTIQKEIENIQFKLNTSINNHDNLKLELSDLESKEMNINKRKAGIVAPATDILKTLTYNLKLTIQKQGELNQQKKDHSRWIAYFTNTHSCTSCLQPIDKEFSNRQLKEFNEKLDELNEDIIFNDGRIKSLNEKIDQINIDIDKYNKEVALIKSELNEITYKKNRIIGDINKEIKSISDYKKEISIKEHQSNPFVDKMKEIEIKKSKLNESRNIISSELDCINSDFIIYGFWVTGFKDIKISQFQNFLTLLENKANIILRSMNMNEWEFKIDYKTDKGGNSSIDINTIHNAKIAPLGRYSGGEGTRLRIIFQMALGAILEGIAGITYGIELFDEPFSYLSEIGVYELVDLLKEYSVSSGKKVFLIDHSVHSYGDFTNTLNITKDSTGSHFEWGK